MDSNNKGSVVVRERKIPAFKEGETNCLGLCMKSKEALNTIAGILVAEDFYWSEHQHIYNTILTLFKANQHVDVLTVGDALGKQGLLEAAKGQSYIGSIYDISLDASQAEGYANQVRDWSILRSIAEESEKTIATIYSGDVSNPIELIGNQSKILHNVGDRLSRGAIARVDDLLGDAAARYELAHNTEEKKNLGRSTGFSTLDRITGGLQDNDYVVIAARSNVGKTALGLHFCSHIAMNEMVPTLIFSLEMKKDKLLDRIIAMEAHVDALEMRKGNLDNAQYKRVEAAIARLAKAPILIDDSGEATMMEIKSKCMKMLNEYGTLGAVMIDYIDLIDPPHFRAEGHAQLADISKQLTKLKNELPCPLIVLAQLNRNADGRSKEDKRPQPTDIGGTDRIYRDCDVCLMLHDPNPPQPLQQYNGNSYAARSEAVNGGNSNNIIELIVGKQRNGPKGIMNLRYDRGANRFLEAI